VLKRRFATEPRWVDLRPYRGSSSPRGAEFTGLCANFAAEIHGTPKEDLLAQEVRQQRRALILAWSAVVTLVALVAAAGWQWRVAETERTRAEAQTKVAETERTRAEAQTKVAQDQTKVAEVQTNIAEARLTALSAQNAEGAVLLAYNIRTIGANNLSSLLMIEDLTEKNTRTAQNSAERGRIEQQLALTRKRIAEIEPGLTATFGHYVGIVMDLARLDPPARKAAQDAVHRSFVQQGIDDFYKDYQAIVNAETEQLAAARLVMSDAMRREWLEEIDATRERRRAKFATKTE
jgi:Tfp pilus assembly protein PilE